MKYVPSDESDWSLVLHGDGEGVTVVVDGRVDVRPHYHLNDTSD